MSLRSRDGISSENRKIKKKYQVISDKKVMSVFFFRERVE